MATRVRLKQKEINPDDWYGADYLAGRWGVHPITIWGWARCGIIPPQTKLGPNTSRWQGRTILEHERKLRENV